MKAKKPLHQPTKPSQLSSISHMMDNPVKIRNDLVDEAREINKLQSSK